MAEAGATHYLRKTGWLKVYRSEQHFAALQPNSISPRKFGLPLQALDTDGAQALEPSLTPVFRACGVLAGGGEREQSARRDARLCRALSPRLAA